MTGRSVSWSDEQTETLIEIWCDNTIQSELVGSTRNITVYRRIADYLNTTFGFVQGVDCYKTAEQCRVKIKNLKTEYKKIGENINNDSRTGRGLKNCKAFDSLDRIMKARSMTEDFDLSYTADYDQVEPEEKEYGAEKPGKYGGDSEFCEQAPMPSTAPFNVILTANVEQVKEEEDENSAAQGGESGTEIGNIGLVPTQPGRSSTTVSQTEDEAENHNNQTPMLRLGSERDPSNTIRSKIWRNRAAQIGDIGLVPTQPERPSRTVSQTGDEVENHNNQTIISRLGSGRGPSNTIRSKIWRNIATPLKRKRKMSNSEVAIESLILQFAESQKAFCEMEDRRMRHEVEMEEKRRESEERIREADRRHQIRMMQLMIQAIQSKSTSPSLPSI